MRYDWKNSRQTVEVVKTFVYRFRQAKEYPAFTRLQNVCRKACLCVSWRATGPVFQD